MSIAQNFDIPSKQDMLTGSIARVGKAYMYLDEDGYHIRRHVPPQRSYDIVSRKLAISYLKGVARL